MHSLMSDTLFAAESNPQTYSTQLCMKPKCLTETRSGNFVQNPVIVQI